LRKLLTLLLFLLLLKVEALEIVDRYLENSEINRGVNRLYFLSKDERYFTCSGVFVSCVSPEDIDKKLKTALEKSNNSQEKEIIKNFFSEKAVLENSFIWAFILFREKRFFETIEKLEEILETYPKNIFALKYLAKASLETSNLKLAEESLKKIIELKTDDSDSYFQLIDIYLKEERFSDAEKTLNLVERYFRGDERIPKYREKLENSQSLWSSIFGDDKSKTLEKEIEKKDPFEEVKNIDDVKKIEIKSISSKEIPKELLQVDENRSLYFLLELNRVVDDSIENKNKKANFIISDVSRGIDELRPIEHNTLYLQPNFNALYKKELFGQTFKTLLNFNYRYYLSGENSNYYSLTPTFSFGSKNFSVQFFYSMIDLDGVGIGSYGAGFDFRFFDIDFSTKYKINSFDISILDRDTLTFDIDKLFYVWNSNFRTKYQLTMNSLSTEPKIPYVIKDINQTEESNVSSTIYPAKYLSHSFIFEYSKDNLIFQDLTLELGILFRIISFDVARSDQEISIFSSFIYNLNRSSNIALHLKRFEAISDEDGSSFYENIVGLNYMLFF
jgi:tetratricopeptide (TPR) repeat protein